jgi:hypothetical protein
MGGPPRTLTEDYQTGGSSKPRERRAIQPTSEVREARGARHDEEIRRREFTTGSGSERGRRFEPIDHQVDDSVPLAA